MTDATFDFCEKVWETRSVRRKYGLQSVLVSNDGRVDADENWERVSDGCQKETRF